MKNTLLTLALLLTLFFANAQITYEHTYPLSVLPLIKLETSGYKYVLVDTQITLYNLDHTVFKQIQIPVQPGADSYVIHYLSETLFNTDSSDMEYLLVGTIGTFGIGDRHYVKIYTDMGNTIFSKDSVSLMYGGGNSNGYYTQAIPIRNTSEGTKLFLLEDGIVLGNATRVYSLPGSLECLSCIAQNGISGLNNVGADAGFLSTAPNPASNFTRINFRLPDGSQKGNMVIYSMEGRELKRYPVDRSSEYLTLSVIDLASGTYFYSLEAEGKSPTARRMIVIR
ncbi:MAG TPA: T9SS type A sorting domain-containing protein [Chitinophagales bacterium]|nr:T9SS type A sorting domain-containing protein [Chitinophagales bacterium]